MELKKKLKKFKTELSLRLNNYKFCKFIGSTILLLSFFTQWSIMNYAQTLKQEWSQTSNYKANIETHALLDQLMFFMTKSVTGNDDVNWLRQAGEKHTMYIFPNLMARKESIKNENIRTYNDLIIQSKNITSLDSFNELSNQINKHLKDSPKLALEKIDRMTFFDKASFWTYVFLYTLGSIITIRGGWLEYCQSEIKDVNEQKHETKQVPKKK